MHRSSQKRRVEQRVQIRRRICIDEQRRKPANRGGVHHCSRISQCIIHLRLVIRLLCLHLLRLPPEADLDDLDALGEALGDLEADLGDLDALGGEALGGDLA